MYKVNPEDFKPSKRFYAVLPSTLYCRSVSSSPDRKLFKITIDACWYRLKSGVISAHVGELWDFQYEVPQDHVQFCRHGGECRSRIDEFQNFWSSSQDLDTISDDSEFLDWMRIHYPSIPDGWDGWWRF